MNLSIQVYDISKELRDCIDNLIQCGFDITYMGVSKENVEFNSVFSFAASDFSLTMEVTKKKFVEGILHTKRINIPYEHMLSYHVFISCYEDTDSFVS